MHSAAAWACTCCCMGLYEYAVCVMYVHAWDRHSCTRIYSPQTCLSLAFFDCQRALGATVRYGPATAPGRCGRLWPDLRAPAHPPVCPLRLEPQGRRVSTPGGARPELALGLRNGRYNRLSERGSPPPKRSRGKEDLRSGRGGVRGPCRWGGTGRSWGAPRPWLTGKCRSWSPVPLLALWLPPSSGR
eukprot:SAG25_NODE_889_length_4913_cov_47.520980_3_plen_187_part_00